MFLRSVTSNGSVANKEEEGEIESKLKTTRNGMKCCRKRADVESKMVIIRSF